MRRNTGLWVSAALVLALLTGFTPGAYGKHDPKPTHYKVKKNAGQFGGNYMAPKKQKKPTGWYRSTLTGNVVYGKPPKQ